jgi:hypothetical protein
MSSSEWWRLWELRVNLQAKQISGSAGIEETREFDGSDTTDSE